MNRSLGHQDREIPVSPDTTYSGGAADSQPIPPSNGATAGTPPPPQPPPLMVPYKKAVAVRYMECLKNHAAAMGGAATDGCGEFMPSGDDGSPESLRCSACDCHRNFHRKETEFLQSPIPPNLHGAKSINNGGNLGYPTEGLMMMPQQQMAMSYRVGASSDQSDERRVIKKRFRTKFTEEQKERMLGFAERAGWKIQKQEESVVQQFCQEIGIKRRVLKVWMHNNKNNYAKKNVPS